MTKEFVENTFQNKDIYQYNNVFVHYIDFANYIS